MGEEEFKPVDESEFAVNIGDKHDDDDDKPSFDADDDKVQGDVDKKKKKVVVIGDTAIETNENGEVLPETLNKFIDKPELNVQLYDQMGSCVVGKTRGCQRISNYFSHGAKRWGNTKAVTFGFVLAFLAEILFFFFLGFMAGRVTQLVDNIEKGETGLQVCIDDGKLPGTIFVWLSSGAFIIAQIVAAVSCYFGKKLNPVVSNKLTALYNELKERFREKNITLPYLTLVTVDVFASIGTLLAVVIIFVGMWLLAKSFVLSGLMMEVCGAVSFRLFINRIIQTDKDIQAAMMNIVNHLLNSARAGGLEMDDKAKDFRKILFKLDFK